MFCLVNCESNIVANLNLVIVVVIMIVVGSINDNMGTDGIKVTHFKDVKL